MKLRHYDEVEEQKVTAEGARGATARWLIGEAEGAPNFYMRRFELEPGGGTPRHSHRWEHEVYVLRGEGTVYGNGRENGFRAGDAVYLPPGEEHYFEADEAGEGVAFLCLIPTEGAEGSCGSGSR